MLVKFSPVLERSCESSVQLYLCVMSHLCGIVCPVSNDNKHSTVAKEMPNIRNMSNVGASNKSPIH